MEAGCGVTSKIRTEVTPTVPPPEVQSQSQNLFLSAEYQRRHFPVCFCCSLVKKVLKLLTTGSEDCYYTGIVKNQ